MKTTFKRALGAALLLLMAVSVFTPACTYFRRNESGPDLKVTAENSTLTWGDTLTLDVEINNTGDTPLEYVKVESVSYDQNWFAVTQQISETVSLIPVGEKKTVSISYPTKNPLGGTATSSLPVSVSTYRMSQSVGGFTHEARVTIGASSFRFALKITGNNGSTVQPSATEVAESPRPTANDRYSFINFYSDIRDIHVNESAAVTFFAEMMSETIIGQSVMLQSNAEGNIGELRDDGVAPDVAADDGVFTGTFTLSSDARKNVTYRAACEDIASEPMNICYYQDLTQSDFDKADDIVERVASINDYDGIVHYLAEDADIESYIENEEQQSIAFTTSAGITAIWDFNYDTDRKAGIDRSVRSLEASVIHSASVMGQAGLVSTASNKDIAVIRPFRSTDFRYDDFLDCANGIAGALGGSVTVRDDGAATLDFMKSLDDYGIVLFDTHGTRANVTNSAWYIFDSDPYILTGSVISSEIETLFNADWQASRIVVCANSRRVAVGAGFFDYYYPDHAFDNTVFFLGACYSMINDTIADALIRKGASVVYGYSQPVYVNYCNDTLDEIMLQSMALNATNAGTAFNNAVAKYGDRDPQSPSNNPCYLRMKGDPNYSIAVDNGVISGVVSSYSSGQPIRLALLEITDQNGQLVRTVTSDAEDGSFEVSLPAGTYSVRISAYGFLVREINNVVVNGGAVTYISDSAMLYAEDEPEVGGRVVNTFTGESVPGATIRFRKGHGTRTGNYAGSVTLTSGSNGEFYTNALGAGYYTAEVECEGYITAYVDVVSAAACTDQELPLTPTIAADQMRIVLTWGEYPSDLDSHLIGPAASGGGKFHTFYDNKSYYSGGEKYADLDLDDVTSYGPEQTTVYIKCSGTYSYYVHDFTNCGSTSSSAMARSGAKVVVYVGEAMVATYNVPSTVDGTLWHVFDFNFDTGVMTPVNTVSYQMNPYTIGD